jgi:hypothetical protein
MTFGSVESSIFILIARMNFLHIASLSSACFKLPLLLFLQSDMIVTSENDTLDNCIASTVARTFYLYLFYLNFYLKLSLHPHHLLEARDVLYILKKVLVNILR